MKKGKIIQVLGPVVDVEFESSDLPYIKDALEVENNGKKCVMEVAQHMGKNVVRCIMLTSSDGLYRDMEVIATGSGIKVPVGKKTLGRLFNVTGQRRLPQSPTYGWLAYIGSRRVCLPPQRYRAYRSYVRLFELNCKD